MPAVEENRPGANGKSQDTFNPFPNFLAGGGVGEAMRPGKRDAFSAERERDFRRAW